MFPNTFQGNQCGGKVAKEGISNTEKNNLQGMEKMKRECQSFKNKKQNSL